MYRSGRADEKSRRAGRALTRSRAAVYMGGMEIRIRRAEPDDYVAYHEIYSCPKAFAGTLQLPYSSRELWRRRLMDPASGTYHLVAVVEDAVVGTFSIRTNLDQPRQSHVGGVGMGVHDAWQGKGVGSAMMRAGLELADNWLNLVRLELEVYTDNEPAIRLYERHGFEREGTLRSYAFRDGKYADAYLMARVRG